MKKKKLFMKLKKEESPVKKRGVTKYNYIFSVLDHNGKTICRNLDNTFSTFLEVAPLDVFTMELYEQRNARQEFIQTLHQYEGNLKLISTNSKYDLKKNIENLKYHLEVALNNNDLPVVEILNDEIKKAELFEMKLRKLKFYFVIYGDTVDELEENSSKLFELYESNRILELKRLTVNETEKVITLLNNEGVEKV